MPRKKLTPEEIRRSTAELYKRTAYFAKHPEAEAKRDAAAKVRDERARVRRMAKYRPELTDIQSNGKYVDVTFIRKGEEVYGTYKLINLQVHSDFHRLEFNRAARFAARVAADEAREKLLREQDKTP